MPPDSPVPSQGRLAGLMEHQNHMPFKEAGSLLPGTIPNHGKSVIACFLTPLS